MRVAINGRDELTFVSHTVRGRQAARVSLRDDETVMLVCGADLVGERRWQGDPRPALRQAHGPMGSTWFRGFFAPQTALGLVVRNLAVRAFALPWLSKPFWASALRDDFTLPECPVG